MNQFVTTLRDDLDGADLAGGTLVIVLLYALTDFDETALAMLAGIVIGTLIAEALLDALGVGPASAGIAFGAIAIGAGASVAVSDAAFVGAAVVAIGCWILLDSVYTWHADGRRSGGDRLEDEQRTNSLLRNAALRLLRPLRLFDPR